jgi:RIO kinase 1
VQSSHPQYRPPSEPAHDLAPVTEPEPYDPFTFAFVPTGDLDPGQRWSRYDEPGVLTGPEPVPDWVITADAAIETELGILKSGKEADVFLLERAVPDDPAQRAVMAAKRYRGEEHRTFHRSAAYTEGRRTRNSRDARALAKKTAHGRAVAAGAWASAEWQALTTLWQAGVPVPYPVQIDGTEVLMELVTADGTPAPRLAATRPDRSLLAGYFDQLRSAMLQLARHGVAHGDLSAYNVLATEDRVVLIDLPQVVDVVANPSGMDFLMRDCRNVCSWFASRGLEVDEHDLFADLVAAAF